MAETNTPPSAPQIPPINPKALVDTAIAVLKNPTEFYKGIKGETGFQKCLVFAVAAGLVYGVILAVAGFLWAIINGLFAAAIVALIVGVITGLVTGLLSAFVGGLIVWGISLAFGSKATWEPSVRIASYSLAILPVSAVGAFLPMIGILGLLLNLAVGAYGIYICVMGAKVLNFDAPPAAAAPPPA